MIRFENVTLRYPNEHTALHNINLTVQSSSFSFITGPSGAGKSTMIRLIMAMLTPTRGNITVGNFNIAQLQARQVSQLRRSIGLVFQDHQLLHNRTVFENVSLPLQIVNTDKKFIANKVTKALQHVHLENLANEQPAHLSVGEQQRVCIARALVNNPKYLIADEPTGNLDDKLSIDIMKIFVDRAIQGTTVMVATHDEYMLQQNTAANVIRLDNGSLLA